MALNNCENVWRVVVRHRNYVYNMHKTIYSINYTNNTFYNSTNITILQTLGQILVI